MAEQTTCRLLLVEDNPADADIASEHLSNVSTWRFEIIYVTRLQEAIKVLRQEPIDVVVLDLNLPDSTGIETLRRLRAVRDDIACFVFSGLASEELRYAALREGAQGFIEKSHHPARMLAQSILSAIERQRSQQQQRQLQKLLSADPDAVIVVETNGTVRFVNEAALALFGQNREDFVGEHLGFSISEGQLSEVEVLRGGARRTAEVRVVDLEWEGQPAFLAVLRDITEQKKLAEQLRLAQKMEAIGQLAGGIAHDFNNILTVICGHIDFVRADLPPDHSVQKDLANIERAAGRATEIVRQILTFSRQQKAERKVIALLPIVQEASRFLKATLAANIDIHVRFDPELPAVLADATQIYQILMNLGTNATHAMQERGGILELHLTSVALGAEAATLAPELRPGQYICLAVSDTGHGMNNETLQHIFDPFFTTKALGEGTGLGLSVVHGIVKEHDGAISVASEPDTGTIFNLYFPAIGSSPSNLQSTTTQAPYGQHETILYVDDEEALVSLVTQLLGRYSYRVSGFCQPEAALRAFLANPKRFAAAIVDHSMPGIDGPEMVRRLLDIRPDLPIIMVTGYARPDDADMMRQLGIRELLLKPDMLKQLANRLHDILTNTQGK
jgi:two-component system, cell cycle sensor histidine kinase and response regulator CckA